MSVGNERWGLLGREERAPPRYPDFERQVYNKVSIAAIISTPKSSGEKNPNVCTMKQALNRERPQMLVQAGE